MEGFSLRSTIERQPFHLGGDLATRRLRWSALITVSLILTYGATLVWSYHALLKLSTFRDQIRDLRIQSFAALQSQLDEETGLRGYVDTGDPEFLDPLRSAAAHIDTALAGLQTAGQPFHLRTPRAA
jgi:CHASE3 domain sensor protein